MIFGKKYEAAAKWLRERSGKKSAPADEVPENPENLPSMEELKQEAAEEIVLEKGDLPAMILAGMLTILPVCLIVLILLCLLAVGFLFF